MQLHTWHFIFSKSFNSFLTNFFLCNFTYYARHFSAGFGSRLFESLREEYPMNYLMSVTFAPCASGESPLQHYNSLLCLSTLQRYDPLAYPSLFCLSTFQRYNPHFHVFNSFIYLHFKGIIFQNKNSVEISEFEVLFAHIK